jgi:hypothetical protein
MTLWPPGAWPPESTQPTLSGRRSSGVAPAPVGSTDTILRWKLLGKSAASLSVDGRGE